MKRLRTLLLLLFCTLPCSSFAQQRDKEERKEEQEERKAANRDRVDYTLFRRQILTLPEFSQQRKKLAELKKEGKGIAKIYAVVDSLNENIDTRFIIGYIQLNLGDNSANVYEVTFDRGLKNIILIKPTGETLDVEKEEITAPKRPGAKSVPKTTKPAPKKKKADEDEDTEDEEPEEKEKEEKEKPAKGKQKDDDDE